MHYKTVFISDLHIASKKSKADRINNFLKENEFDQIYLVGDVIDIWRFKQAFSFSHDKQSSHVEVIERLLRHSRKGTKIHYIIGNHDEFLSKFKNHNIFGNIDMHDTIEHVTCSGKKFIVMHGHQFDFIAKFTFSPILYKLGDIGYDIMMDLNDVLNWVRRIMGMKYWSLSKHIKIKFKKASQFLDTFESIIVKYCKQHKYDGMICGHIHDPKIKEIDNIVYANTGCWTEKENCSFIYEDEHGNLKLEYYEKPKRLGI